MTSGRTASSSASDM
ncbi:hypothetical protein STIAU_0231, partial [Stigmatella aurantiaca DW4/3-1]